MRLPMVFVVARAEMRSNRRLTRYWVFAVISTFVAIGLFGNYTFVHGMFSNMSGTIGAMGPRYLMSVVGVPLVLVFLVGLVFLAFDVRARDERDRMVEVLDSRPLSNGEFLLGKVVGLVFASWIPVLFIAILFESFGFMAINLDWQFGDPVEPYSLFGFLFGTLDSLLLWCSIIVLIAVVTRHRILIALIALALLGLQVWIVFNLPLYLQQWLSIMHAFDMASDILPRFIAESDGTRVFSHLAMASGFLCLAIALHPRRDGGSTPRMFGAAAGLLAISVMLLGVYVWQVNRTIEQLAVWRSAHEAKQAMPRADMQSLSGTLSIKPGDVVSMELELEVEAPRDRSMSTLIFSFNPGFTVTDARVDGGAAGWSHQDGLLEIKPQQSIAQGSGTVVSLQASGTPDEFFGYLDTHLNLAEADFTQGAIGILGLKTSIFEPTYIAMMPGAHWLPSTGTDVPQGEPRTHPNDYYRLDLEVEIPADWLVAGPGRRQKLTTDGETSRYRFRPQSPLPHVGLVASRFERRAMKVADVEFEVLLHPGHDRNLKFFADAQMAIRERLGELFLSARKLGLPYPYDGLSLVETPNVLRGYGGGWRMDTVQSMQGVLLLRENSFPTSRFELRFTDPEDYEDEEGGLGLAKLNALEQYFENDFSGGNLFTGGSRNFLQFQTSATGEGAHAVNFVLDELVSRLLTDKRGYFSAHEFGQQINMQLGQIIEALVLGQTQSIAEQVQRAATERPSVWDRALGTSLADLQPSEAPRLSLNVLALKSEAIARSILDGVGRENTAAILAELVNQFRGRHFQITDLYRIAADLNIALEPLLGDWLSDASLPGFLMSSVTSVRLTDDDQANPQYQTRVHIRNDEATPGLLRLRYQWGDVKEPTWDVTDPIRVPGYTSLEIGIVTMTPLFQLWTQPYLALNRVQQRLKLPKVDSEQRHHADRFVGTRSSDWQRPDYGDIVVDDLDSGFTIWRSEPQQEARFLAPGLLGSIAIDMDQGLPEYQLMHGQVNYWSRAVYFDSWGKYRKTMAVINPDSEKDSRAIFTTSLPQSGRWRLAYYLGANNDTKSREPQFIVDSLSNSSLGKYDMTLVSDSDRRKIEFDGGAASFGWNDLGEFRLPAGETSIEVASVTTGSVVVADAIRWRPVTRGN